MIPESGSLEWLETGCLAIEAIGESGPRLNPAVGRALPAFLRHSVSAPSRGRYPPLAGSAGCGAGASAISAISLRMIAWPNELKFSAETTKAPAPPITLSRK